MRTTTILTNNHPIIYPCFRGGNILKGTAQSGTDVFQKNIESPVFTCMKDIKDYLKANADKIENGKIFNKKIMQSGESLLTTFLHLIPTIDKDNDDDYDNLLFKMMQMPEIDYNQTDSADISVIEWVLTLEDKKLLSLIKDKEFKPEPMVQKAFDRIKNPEFKKMVKNSKLFSLDLGNLDKSVTAYLKALSDFNYYPADGKSIDDNALHLLVSRFNKVTDDINKIDFDTIAFNNKKDYFIEIFSKLSQKEFKARKYNTDNVIDDLFKALKSNKKVLKEVLMNTNMDMKVTNNYMLDRESHRISTNILKDTEQARNYIITLKNIYYDSPEDLVDILLSTKREINPVLLNYLFQNIDKSKVDKYKLKALFDCNKPDATGLNQYVCRDYLKWEHVGYEGYRALLDAAWRVNIETYDRSAYFKYNS